MSWVKQTPQNPVWNKQSASSSWENNLLYGYLFTEDGKYLLQENGDRIRLNLLTDPDWGIESDSGSWNKVVPQTGVWTK